jgi:hypothetical protein
MAAKIAGAPSPEVSADIDVEWAVIGAVLIDDEMGVVAG